MLTHQTATLQPPWRNLRSLSTDFLIAVVLHMFIKNWYRWPDKSHDHLSSRKRFGVRGAEQCRVRQTLDDVCRHLRGMSDRSQTLEERRKPKKIKHRGFKVTVLSLNSLPWLPVCYLHGS